MSIFEESLTQNNKRKLISETVVIYWAFSKGLKTNVNLIHKYKPVCLAFIRRAMFLRIAKNTVH